MALVGAGKKSPPPIAELCDAPPSSIPSSPDSPRPRSAIATLRRKEALVDLAELMKRAPSLPNGERSIRARIGNLMQRLYPAEPARSRAEFARLVAQAKKTAKPRLHLPPPSPSPPPTASADASLLGGHSLPPDPRDRPGLDGRRSRSLPRRPWAPRRHQGAFDRVTLSIASERKAPQRSARHRAHRARKPGAPPRLRVVERRAARFYVMEFLEGETLERRIVRGERNPVARSGRVSRFKPAALWKRPTTQGSFIGTSSRRTCF